MKKVRLADGIFLRDHITINLQIIYSMTKQTIYISINLNYGNIIRRLAFLSDKELPSK